MNKAVLLRDAPIVLLVAVLFAAALAFRPLLPIDETRYLTVAWELFQLRDYSHMTLNYQSYHHKPPLLFFLIVQAWDVFGVSRWAALVPFFIFSLLFVFLCRAVCRRLLPQNVEAAERAPYVALAAFPFLIYGTIVMFDVMLGVFVMAFFLCALAWRESARPSRVLLGGVFLGLGAMTKGPVVLVYAFLPLLLMMAVERREKAEPMPGKWGALFGVTLLIGLAIVGVWLVDLYFETGHEFFESLLMRQTVERINGKMESSHARPFYFYLPLLPVMFLPWMMFPAVWKRARAAVTALWAGRFSRLAVLWFGGCLLAFMAISGKQAHYLLPLLPAAVIFLSVCLEDVRLPVIRGVAVAMVLLAAGGQAVASYTVFPNYDLERFAKIVADNPDEDWAFVRKYQGELGFLGRLTKPLDSLEFDEAEAWFKEHPEGYMIIRHDPEKEVPVYHEVYKMDYRSRALGIFTLDSGVKPPRNLPEAEAAEVK